MDSSAIRAIERPHSSLLFLYFLQSLAALIAFPFVFVPLYFRYHTLRYHFDDEGVSASWGILFRREVYLTYRRIQDIHVSRNIIERWLGIAKVEIQTASGRAMAELTLEGMEHYEAVRDYLYARMRGATADGTAAVEPPTDDSGSAGEAVTLLRAIADDVRAVRRILETRGGGE